MNIFISWSGARSRHIASTLHWWIPHVLQAVKPFISHWDIKKGRRGTAKIADELATSQIGIICLTPENLTAPWILFEGGALSKLPDAYVCTYLYELDPVGVPPPLGDFQHTRSTEGDTLALLRTINDELPQATKLTDTQLTESFAKWYPDLKSKLDDIPEKAADEPEPHPRETEDKLDELLRMMRAMSQTPSDAPEIGTADRQWYINHWVNCDANKAERIAVLARENLPVDNLSYTTSGKQAHFSLRLTAPKGPRGRSQITRAFERIVRQELGR